MRACLIVLRGCLRGIAVLRATMRVLAGCVIWGLLFLPSCSVCRRWCRGLV
uniref:Uncharacterized protein n=1 Tax=Siphoviridae sp. ctkV91 TaxID=2827924 RepID=A0A8S5TDB5_9CAUD|nr:MAG TPA: hypothetical protein [Siphoviridae sp. ctkV91]